jgi:ribose 1,5-bisphosphokinase PhnN
VIANVSRGVIGDARARFSPVRVLSITASPEALRARLVTRGREAVEDIEGRIARAGAYQVTGPDVIAIANDASLEHGIALFLGALCAGNA